MLSIVIPTLEAAGTIEATLAALDDGGATVQALREVETIVVDGGSTDTTQSLAENLGARVITAPRGRGLQMSAGANAAKGDWLLFLHVDTRLAPGWTAAVDGFIADPANTERAGYFRFALDDPAPAARRVERLVSWRCRRLGLPYGDQGLLIARDFYQALGGYRPLVMMEDVALVRRIGPRRLVALDAAALTSARRYRRDGYFVRPARNLLCLALYFLGLPPRLIARIYA